MAEPVAAAAGALALFGGAAAAAIVARRRQQRERARAFLHRFLPPPAESQGAEDPFARRMQGVRERLWQAGITPAPWQLWVAVTVLVIALGGGAVTAGALGALLGPAAVVALAYGALAWQADRRMRQTVAQVPGFIDYLLRAVNVGSTLDEAIAAATRETPRPLRTVFESVVRETRHGASLEVALGQVAERYDLRELHILTTAVRVNQRYGSSIQSMLGSIAAMVRQQEEIQQELRSLTGETRMSAWVLGLFPLLVVAYVLAINPGYFTSLWQDATGRAILFGALTLQVVGGGLLWRVMRTV